MVDWLWNLALEHKVSEIELDIIGNNVYPESIPSTPLISHFPSLKDTINNFLKSNGLESDYLKKITFSIKINESINQLICYVTMEEKNGNILKSKDYVEHPYENDYKKFKIKNLNHSDWSMEADNSLNSAEWFGSIIRYLFHLGNKNFKYFYNQRQLKTNVIIGWIFQILIATLILSFIIYYS